MELPTNNFCWFLRPSYMRYTIWLLTARMALLNEWPDLDVASGAQRARTDPHRELTMGNCSSMEYMCICLVLRPVLLFSIFVPYSKWSGEYDQLFHSRV